MVSKTHMIEVDAAIAVALEGKAAAEGTTVAKLVADMMALATAPVALSGADVAELDRQWAAIQAGEATVPHGDVAQWLQSWGTPAFKPWRDR